MECGHAFAVLESRADMADGSTDPADQRGSDYQTIVAEQCRSRVNGVYLYMYVVYTFLFPVFLDSALCLLLFHVFLFSLWCRGFDFGLVGVMDACSLGWRT